VAGAFHPTEEADAVISTPSDTICPLRRQRLGHCCAWLAAVVCALLSGGCSRNFWRNQADRDVYHLLQHKTEDPRWDVPRTNITPDPRSRIYDPYDPDCGPLPLDDPAAGRYMLHVDWMSGYKGWEDFGSRFSIENPRWLESYGLSLQYIQQASLNNEPSTVAGAVDLRNISLQDAVALSNLHSRDYQFQIENAYLAALAVTFERFQFNVRYLGIGGREPSVDATYTATPGGTKTLDLDSRFGISQLLPSGGQWAVELANNTLWLFSSGNGVATSSAISYSLVQPLLFAAGRKVVLENLTQAERNSLYSVRDLARFRKVFFADVASGYLRLLQQAQSVEIQRDNVRRNLEQLDLLRALSAQVTMIYYENLPQFPAGVVVSPILRDQLAYDDEQKRLYWRGRMSLVQRQALLNLSNDPAWQAAVSSLIQLRLFEPLAALPPGLKFPPSLSGQLSYAQNRLYWKGSMSDEQAQVLQSLSNDAAWQRAVSGLVGRLQPEIRNQSILQLQSRLLTSQNNVRDTLQRYQNQLDGYKIGLGLPPNIKMDISQSLLKPFQLIDPRLSTMEQRLKDYVKEWAKLDETDTDEATLRDVIAGLRKLRDEVQANVLDVLREDAERLQKALPERLQRLSTDEDRARLRADIARDNELRQSLLREFQSITQELVDEKIPQRIPLARVFGQPDTTAATNHRARLMATLGAAQGILEYRRQKRLAVQRIATLREDLLQIAQGAQGIEIGIRVELIDLPAFELSIEEAVRTALATRLDLKNARAQVMDARRRLEVAANRLQAVLNLRVDGDVGTKPGGDNPLDFRARNSTVRVGVAFTAPLDLIAQRNAYRTAQITYQRARRAYMALEDAIKLSVRNEWRILDVQRRNFETLRSAVRVAATQFDNAVEEASAPQVAAAGPPRETSSAGLSLLNALDSVVRSQTGLIGTWIDYETNRLNIYRDMGMMVIDARGLWTDPFYQDRSEVLPTGPPPAPPAPSQPVPASGRAHDLRNSTASNGKIPVGTVRSGIAGPQLRIQRAGHVVSTEKAGKVRLVEGTAENGAAAVHGRDPRRGNLLLQGHP
jgi:outer membrane protein TolC